MTDEDRLPKPYSYCDYLCVKCEFNDECPVYAEELEAQKQGKNKLEALQDCLREIIEMLMQKMEKLNIDIPGEEVEADMKAHSDIHEQIANKPVVKLAYEYLNGVDDFIKDYQEHYLIPVLLSDAFFDLDWYKTIIKSKMQRTLRSYLEFARLDRLFPEFSLEDAYHTSGVVYKALWKSLSAARVLKEALTDYNDILTELENLLLEINNEFRHEFPFMILMLLVQLSQQFYF
jgi:hypothetical protein